MATTDAVSADTRPRIVTALGKQKSGKTMFLRWLVERNAESRQRPLKLIDADPHNDTLKQHYPDAMSPGSTAIEDRRISLEQSIRDQRAASASGNPYDALWDVGGGDLLMARLAHEVRFTETIERAGIDLIAFYMLSPSLSDLEYFEGLENAGFKPKRLALVFNAGLIQGDRQPDRAFEPVVQRPLIATLLSRGALPIFVPALAADCVEAIENSGAKTFRDAIPMLDMWHEMRLHSWLNDEMEQRVAKPLIDAGWMI